MAIKHLYKLEVGETRASSLPWFLRLAKKQSGYRVEKSDDMTVHVVETPQLDTFVALWQHVGTWKNVQAYIDGQMIGKYRIGRLVWEIQVRPEKTKRMLDDVIAEHLRKQDDRDDRMGL